MFHRRKWLNTLLPAICITLLILDSKTALNGAANGISICIKTVIPTLFPFMVLSSILTGALQGETVGIVQRLGKICRMPNGSESLLLVGLIGGYPVGARCIAQQVRSGILTPENAHRLLGFCSNAGPSMIFGMTSLLFDAPHIPWIILLIQWVSAILVGIILPGNATNRVSSLTKSRMSLADAVNESVRAISSVCGWIVLFQVYLNICSKWFMWFFPPEWQTVITGVSELSSGLISLKSIHSSPLRFILCTVMLCFGGLCVAMQTVSVTHGVGIGFYMVGKLLQTMISGVLAMLCCFLLFPYASFMWVWIPLVILVFSSAGFTIYLRKSEKRSRNLCVAVV